MLSVICDILEDAQCNQYVRKLNENNETLL